MLSPLALKNTGYLSYREMVRGMFDCAGAVRIDHILGLFRLWWIPEGHTAVDGTYVYYDHNVMLGILAIEASRVGGIVVGEDLGVVPDYVQKSLSDHGILGCAVEWFEQMDGVFTPPKYWRPYALASVNTHDLPPAAGYLEYEHVKIRERLGLLEEGSEAFEASARAEHNAMLQMLVDQGYLDASLLEDEAAHETEPKYWRPYALASVNTHDLPPAAGYLEYEHVKIRERLGLLEEGSEAFEASARAEHNAMLQMLVDQGYLDASLLEDEAAHETEIIEALYRGLKGSPCKLLAASIVDAVGEKRAQNQPGTDNEYPNWRIPLADATAASRARRASCLLRRLWTPWARSARRTSRAPTTSTRTGASRSPTRTAPP